MNVGQRPDGTLVIEMSEAEASALLSDLAENEDMTASTARMVEDLDALVAVDDDGDEDDDDDEEEDVVEDEGRKPSRR